jgi:hypothetical protein
LSDWAGRRNDFDLLRNIDLFEVGVRHAPYSLTAVAAGFCTNASPWANVMCWPPHPRCADPYNPCPLTLSAWWKRVPERFSRALRPPYRAPELGYASNCFPIGSPSKRGNSALFSDLPAVAYDGASRLLLFYQDSKFDFHVFKDVTVC